MKKTTKGLALTASVLALSAFAVTPAQAAPGDWNINDDNNIQFASDRPDTSFMQWNISDYAGAMGHVFRLMPEAGYDPNDRSTWGNTYELVGRTACSGQHFTVNGQDFAANSNYDISTDSHGDKVITGTGTWDGLDDAVEIRVYGEGDLMRTTHVFTNNTGSDKTVDLSVYHDVTDNVTNGTTSDGDVEFETSDKYFSSWDVEGPHMEYSFFWGAPGLLDTSSLNLEDYESGDPTAVVNLTWDGTQSFQQFTIPAGATYQLVWFNSNKDYTNGETGAAAASDAAANEFASHNWKLTGRLARGLNADLTGNWLVGPADVNNGSGGSLANTGAELNVGLSVFAGLSAIGAGIALVRRRRA